MGGEPAKLMAFIVKYPGLIPAMEILKMGEIGFCVDVNGGISLSPIMMDLGQHIFS